MQYGLLGHPLGHSLSPQLHQLLAQLSGTDLNYYLLDTHSQSIDAVLPRLLQLDGFNVTIPYKQDIIPYLEQMDDSAARYQSVNTVSHKGGKLIGYNTDCIGFMRTLGDRTKGLRHVFLIGAGGVGRMFAIEMARLGANITIGVRPSSLVAARELTRELIKQNGIHADALLISDFSKDTEYDLLINASPCGMFPHTAECPAPTALIERCRIVFDCIYNPQCTQLLQKAREMGKETLGGMKMLVWQGAAAQEIWYGARFSNDQISWIEERLNALL